jgi:hypothetical protein
MYVQRNVKAPSCVHFCKGKTISVTYCECVFVALVVQHAMRVRRIVIRDLCNIFLRCLTSGTTFDTIIRYEMCVLVFYTVFV